MLLTVLGTRAQSARYALKGMETEAQLAPLALLDLLPPDGRPNRVLAICTPEAKQASWPVLRDGLGEGVESGVVEVASDATENASGDYMSKVASAVPADADLTVDITHGFRHYSFLTYLAVLYMSELRGVRVQGAYYGLLQEGVSPFIDLRPLLMMPGWIHAVQVLRDTGSALPMVRTIEAGSSSSTGSRSQISRELSRFLKLLSESHLSGLPLETGYLADEFLKNRHKALARLFREEHRLPLSDELAGQLKEFLKPFSLAQPVRGPGWKRGIRLGESELQRQAGIVDYHLEHGEFPTALGLMNEWTVSWVLWQTGERDDWLNFRKQRRRAANILNAIRTLRGDSKSRWVLTEDQRLLGKFWSDLTQLRNGLHHHGMRPQPLFSDSGDVRGILDDVIAYWQTLKLCPEISLSIGDSPGRHVLVSPIGIRPGSLFSAVQACREENGGEDPGLCIAICSAESGDMVQDALGHAGYQGRVETLPFEDPHGGVSEIEELAKKAGPLLIGAERVTVNITGGTTLMGLAVEKIAAEAKRLGCPVGRFGLIDRRPPEEQSVDPYRMGEAFWIESATEGSEGEDGC